MAGTYITAASVLYPFVESAVIDELFDDDADGSVDTTVFDGMVTFVEAQFHSYTCRRYQVPLDVTDATILASAQFFCARLFEYLAYSRRQTTTPEIKIRYEQTIKELEGIRDGKLGFNDPASGEASAVGGEYTHDTDDRDFTAAKMASWGGGGTRE